MTVFFLLSPKREGLSLESVIGGYLFVVLSRPFPQTLCVKRSKVETTFVSHLHLDSRLVLRGRVDHLIFSFYSP